MSSPKTQTKSDKWSTEWRANGDQHFRRNTLQHYLIALQMYNKAICFAPSHSESLYFALVKRSTVYLNLSFYDECVKSINFIRKCYQIDEGQDAINLNEKICKAQIPDEDKTKKFVQILPKLSYPQNKRVGCIANCLKFDVNERHDDHIVAKSNLKVGEIVSNFKPFISILMRIYQRERCENCCKENSKNLIPCPGCTTAMFCDEKCMAEATNRFHKYECSYMDFISVELGDYHRLALRIIIFGISLFDTIDDFVEFTTNAFKVSISIERIDQNSVKGNYALVCSLPKDKWSPHLEIDTKQLTMVCSEIFMRNNLKSIKPVAEYYFMLRNIVQQFLLLVPRSSTSVASSPMNKTWSMLAIFPLMHFFIPSCTPNAVLTNIGNEMITSIIRPIKAGEPLTISLAPEFFEAPKAERLKKMTFECQCTACTEDWPMLEDLRPGTFEFPFELKKNVDTANYNRIVAQKNYQMTVDAMQNNDREMPCQKLVKLSWYYKHIMYLIYCQEIPVALRADENIIKKF